ncbi:hypothetical protein JQ596_37235 [Bradyrhizobium manausense]|uniref:hypothetical protein n=1 Tax=Bradyrhizobium TaxID=374 RepID=UPI001BAD159D|nr:MULTISPECIES: hypothetical protein [Bradyrhizobium]MBR0831167.1 hypothetical protein [Bradyrhizobium manausense]UVO32643.1 hypothetical protein KUF59_19470 [Bradyrhizobium arachidis]
MNWAWASSLDELWRSPTFPMWVTLAAAGFFGLIVLFTLLRAEKSVANGALTVITLLAIGIAVAATIRFYGPSGRAAPNEARAQPVTVAALPALSCIDDLAGDIVLSACEKTLFGSSDAVAAAVSYAAAQISRLTALGDVASANKVMTSELKALRRAVEHDRYGLVAQVLATRDNCTPSECAAFLSVTDRAQIVANMDAHVFEGLIARYAPAWNAPGAQVPPGPLAALPPSMPTGKPTNAEFPSASSTPPVSIMSPEPPVTAAKPAPAAPAAASAPRPAAAPVQAAAPPPAAKKQPAPKAARAPAAAPVQIAPPASAAAPAAADND